MLVWRVSFSPTGEFLRSANLFTYFFNDELLNFTSSENHFQPETRARNLILGCDERASDKPFKGDFSSQSPWRLNALQVSSLPCLWMKSVFIWALLAPSLRELPRCTRLGKEGRGEGEKAAPSGSLEDAGVTPSVRLIGHCTQSQQSHRKSVGCHLRAGVLPQLLITGRSWKNHLTFQYSFLRMLKNLWVKGGWEEDGYSQGLPHKVRRVRVGNIKCSVTHTL